MTQSSAWHLENLVRSTRRAIEARRRLPASTPPPPAAPPPSRRQDEPVALGIVNFGRVRSGEAPLETLPYRGPPQPEVERIDAEKLAAAIVQAGRVARGEIPVPLPTDPVARAIVVAGERARRPSPRAAAFGSAGLNEKLEE
jgi:hypothetical protein